MNPSPADPLIDNRLFDRATVVVLRLSAENRELRTQGQRNYEFLEAGYNKLAARYDEVVADLRASRIRNSGLRAKIECLEAALGGKQTLCGLASPKPDVPPERWKIGYDPWSSGFEPIRP